ncbi:MULTISPECIES: hypothetical protein [Photobacterium]|uniref:Uncharacterized protein n=1 Tax=Photobacterium toruni TaxID=1935446 RepID=A0A1T4UJU6_9GAMM|nr:MULTISPECIES: hypothetical protein [Photobacterium]MCD9516410.1 hypothetical protein [Photobacterium carnosum]SKA52957.1 hypothetical protein CZ814_03376 [Photobacterium toruni]
MTTSNSPWQIAELLPRFYKKNALSIGGKAPQLIVSSFKFSHDESLISRATNPPTLKRFPPNKNTVENVFYENKFNSDDIIYSEGRLMFRCIMAENTLSSPREYSLTTLHDQDGDIVAVSVDLPDWVTPGEGVNTHPYINFPIGDA